LSAIYLLSNHISVTQDFFTTDGPPDNLFFKGQFWGRAALAPVDLSIDPGAFPFAKLFRLVVPH
jgi:hypothetical protein